MASETIIKAINDQLKINGKYKFLHFVHDLGLRCSTAVVLFTFGLTYCLVIPLVAPLMCVVFIFGFYLDKYNLIFVYPIEFDSQVNNRECLVRFSLLGILTFQAVTALTVWRSLDNSWCIVIVTVIVLELIGYLLIFKVV